MFRVTLILLSIVAPALFSDNRYKEFMADFKHCKRERRINPFDLDRLRVGDLDDSSYEAKCFLACLYDRTGILRSGVLQIDILKKNVGYIANHVLLDEILPPCYKVTGTNKCVTAFKLKKCFQNIGFDEVWITVPWEENNDPQYIASMKLINSLTNMQYRVAFA
uniref:Uncharacterized protein n=1 Tax=Glossina palpalis gambiensis TaxID=67801 RepID=A0A1B0AU35_9MUSC